MSRYMWCRLGMMTCRRLRCRIILQSRRAYGSIHLNDIRCACSPDEYFE
ncbi:hypothetical protein JI435_410970 [Parastagonospora nodorum SN15]|uniref:Uncharacterized protein n=1 Tax=Phaeosphaeria nodorum (strain SN15 / ATCC MYA-4574 / FGSC 10173) TaxID=321614 RepID=A0A7U2F3H2_PHANO|nr:hypothetical protein JI435_410970 [Parastagonospora nodorum SN15]